MTFSWAHAVSTLVLVLYLLGWRFSKRSRRTAHIVLMSLGMSIDVVLTLYLEMARGAVETAATGAQNFTGSRPLLLYVHAPISLFVLVVCYGMCIYLGVRTARATGTRYVALRQKHARWGYVTLVLYTVSLLTAPRFVVDQVLALF